MLDTTSIGTISEGVLLGALLKAGYQVLVPFGEHSEYDLVIHKDRRFFPIQCKTGRIQLGSMRFKTYTVVKKLGGGYTRRSYASSVAFYGVYCPDNGQCYLIPAHDTPTSEMSLRLEAPKNNQQKKVRWAREYQL